MADRVDLLSSISGILKAEAPIEFVPKETAAVAVIVRGQAAGDEVLLIRRAKRKSDPWSGQVALPGGRVSPEDGSFRKTAERESLEEVGLDLARAKFSGYVGAFRARTGSIRVVAAVFLIGMEQKVRLNREASSYRWVPISEFLAPERRRIFTLEWGGELRRFPSFEFDGYVVWGLTERILSTLIEVVRRRRYSSG